MSTLNCLKKEMKNWDREWSNALGTKHTTVVRMEKVLICGKLQHVRKMYPLGGVYRIGWILDGDVSFCMVCLDDFSWSTRKHHCRACGSVICSKCSPNRVKIINCGERISKVCNNCFGLRVPLSPSLCEVSSDSVSSPFKETECEKHLRTLSLRAIQDNFRKCINAYRFLRSLIPVDISQCSVDSLMELGIARDVAIRIWAVKPLHLIVMHHQDIMKIHIADLRGRYNPLYMDAVRIPCVSNSSEEGGNPPSFKSMTLPPLDLTELRAIWFALPPEHCWEDGVPGKHDWRESLRRHIDSMSGRELRGQLPPHESVNVVYQGVRGRGGPVDPRHPIRRSAVHSTWMHSDASTSTLAKAEVEGGAEDSYVLVDATPVADTSDSPPVRNLSRLMQWPVVRDVLAAAGVSGGDSLQLLDSLPWSSAAILASVSSCVQAVVKSGREESDSVTVVSDCGTSMDGRKGVKDGMGSECGMGLEDVDVHAGGDETTSTGDYEPYDIGTNQSSTDSGDGQDVRLDEEEFHEKMRTHGYPLGLLPRPPTQETTVTAVEPVSESDLLQETTPTRAESSVRVLVIEPEVGGAVEGTAKTAVAGGGGGVGEDCSLSLEKQIAHSPASVTKTCWNPCVQQELCEYLREGRATDAHLLLRTMHVSQIPHSYVLSTEESGELLLHCGQYCRHLQDALGTLTLLLDVLGAPLDASDASGRTALMLVADCPELCVCMLERGADPLRVDRTGQCALSLDLDQGNGAVLTFLESTDRWKTLPKNERRVCALALLRAGYGGKVASLIGVYGGSDVGGERVAVLGLNTSDVCAAIAHFEGHFGGMKEPMEMYELLESLDIPIDV